MLMMSRLKPGPAIQLLCGQKFRWCSLASCPVNIHTGHRKELGGGQSLSTCTSTRDDSTQMTAGLSSDSWVDLEQPLFTLERGVRMFEMYFARKNLGEVFNCDWTAKSPTKPRMEMGKLFSVETDGNKMSVNPHRVFLCSLIF